MNFYVLDENQVQLGPFTAAELKEKGLLPEALVRTETSSDWVQASELPELASIFNPSESAPLSEEPLPNAADETTESTTDQTGNVEQDSSTDGESTVTVSPDEPKEDTAIVPVAPEKKTSHQQSRQSYQNIYEDYFNVDTLSDEEKARFSKHNFSDELGVGVCILLHFITCGIFTTIYCGLKYSNLPKVKADDFGAGQAIGFLFIPFFNFYWVFVFWRTLAQRINFQFKLRGKPAPVSVGLATAYCILIFIPYLGLFTNTLILGPILLSQIQSASIELAEEKRTGYSS